MPFPAGPARHVPRTHSGWRVQERTRREAIDRGKERGVTERDIGTERKLPAGIVIRGAEEDEVKAPAITAFIWGGKVRPVPTLPFGRWKARQTA